MKRLLVISRPAWLPAHTLMKSTRKEDGSYLIEGAANLREINKELDWNFNTDGPRTLNGLILEYLEDLPEEETSDGNFWLSHQYCFNRKQYGEARPGDTAGLIQFVCLGPCNHIRRHPCRQLS